MVAPFTETLINNYGGGIEIASDKTTIIGNTIKHNTGDGIRLIGSNNTLRNNKISNNTSNFSLKWEIGWEDSTFVNDVDSSNLVDCKPVIYWVNKQDRKVPENAAFVALVNCSNILIENLDLSNVGQGVVAVSSANLNITRISIQATAQGITIYRSSGILINNVTINGGSTGICLVYSSKNTMIDNMLIYGGSGIHLISSSENTVRNNVITKRVGRGILLDYSYDNLICWNIISGGSFAGISLDGSKYNVICGNLIADCRELALTFWNNASENLFYLNNFINNTRNTAEYLLGMPAFPINFWYNNTLGNFWSDYTARYPNAKEVDGSGIWDIPYVINEHNKDCYPLTRPVVIPKFANELPTTTSLFSSPDNASTKESCPVCGMFALMVTVVMVISLIFYFAVLRKIIAKLKVQTRGRRNEHF
ncbi:MAG: NosD domain-containing protein [Candidatus Bathyarchaeia archaeon]